MQISTDRLQSLRLYALVREQPEVGLAWGRAGHVLLSQGRELKESGLDPMEVAEILSDVAMAAKTQIAREWGQRS